MSTEALVETLVEQVKTKDGWPDPRLLADILARGSEAVEPLRALLQRDYKEWPEVELFWFVAELLESLGDAGAIPGLLGLFRRIDDEVLENVSFVLGRLGPAVIEPALEIIRDESLPWYPRVSACTAAVGAAGDDAVARARIAQTLRGVLTDCLRKNDEAQAKIASDDEQDDNDEDHDELDEAAVDEANLVHMASMAVDELANLADPLARGLIDQAYKANIIDTWLIRRKDIEKVYRQGGRIPVRETEPFLSRYEGDYLENQEHARRLAEKEARRLARPPVRPSSEPSSRPPIVEPIRKTTPRPGRNEPCWCGSGKKYKQCHLRADES